MRFSQRIGKTPLSKPVQIESIDDDLKNGLWNVCDMYILKKLDDHNSGRTTPWKYFSNSLWHHFFKQTVDSIPSSWYYAKEQIKIEYFESDWVRSYDIIEAIVDLIDDENLRGYFDEELILDQFNHVLQTEFSAYRFINKNLSPITNPTEISEIEDSLSATNNFTSLKSCNMHLGDALNKLSDKVNPDYRNSIKESISAVESVAKVISGNQKDSLGGALDKIKGKLKIHQSLEKGFKNLYGYTSDSGGIRHALTESDSFPDFEDAKFMLVSCSAFINYLIAKANKTGVIIQ